MTSVRLPVLAAALALAACGPSDPPPADGADAPADAPASDAAPAAFAAGKQGVRGVDFRNLRYGAGRDTFTLANGERLAQRQPGPVNVGWILDDVAYGDVTGDGADEAIVTVEEVTGGSATPARVFVYGVRDGAPAPIWDFRTGDRAAGGLRRVYAEDGALVVELNGGGSVPGRGRELRDEKGVARCCPARFTRTRLRWTGSAFQAAGEPEVLPVPPRSE